MGKTKKTPRAAKVRKPATRDIQRHRAMTHREPRLGSGSVLAGLIEAAGGADALTQPAPRRGTFTTVGDSLVRVVPRRGKELVFTGSVFHTGAHDVVRVELMLNTDGEYVFEVSLNGRVLGLAPLGEHVELQVVTK